jgi:hypothetical protein
MNIYKSSPLSLIALMVLLAMTATAAPTSTTGGTNAAVSICKVATQKGCKGVGIRGDQCCPDSNLFCNIAALSVPSGGTSGICGGCVRCQDNVNYQTAPCGGVSGTADRVCTTCRNCADTFGTYANGGCKTTAAGGVNRVCDFCQNYQNVAVYAHPGVDCVVETCKDGYYKNSAGLCVACAAECVNGVSYQSQTCTTAHDRICTTCRNCADTFGTYANGGCSTPVITEVGVDRTCDYCPNWHNADTYTNPGVDCKITECNSENYDSKDEFGVNGGCIACSAACEDGTSYQDTVCETAHDRHCTTCAVCGGGLAYLNGQDTCKTADVNAVGTDRTCTTCSTCSSGQHVSQECTATSNTECEADVVIVEITEDPVLDCGTSCTECQTCAWSDTLPKTSICKNKSDGVLCSSNAGFCSSGSCTIPTACRAATKPGCNVLCAFDIENGVKGRSYHCRYTKAAVTGYAKDTYVCGNNDAACKPNNCDCSDTNNSGRRMLGF